MVGKYIIYIQYIYIQVSSSNLMSMFIKFGAQKSRTWAAHWHSMQSWLVHRDPYNGLLQSLYNWGVSLYTANNYGFGHCSTCSSSPATANSAPARRAPKRPLWRTGFPSWRSGDEASQCIRRRLRLPVRLVAQNEGAEYSCARGAGAGPHHLRTARVGQVRCAEILLIRIEVCPCVWGHVGAHKTGIRMTASYNPYITG